MRVWLIKRREASKMTQDKISDMAGISRSAYSNIENGERNPSVETAKKIATVLDFDWTKFFEKDDEMLKEEEQDMKGV